MIKSIITNSCPACLKGKIFFPLFSSPFKMHSSCSNCSFKYEKEPGFFWGSMYVSYAISSFLFLSYSFSAVFLFDFSITKTFFTLLFIMLFFVPLIFRFSRILWINLFYNEKKNK